MSPKKANTVFTDILHTYATAMVLAQLLERSLLTALMMHRWMHSKLETPATFRASRRLTLGQLVAHLRQADMIDEATAVHLKSLVAERNMLAHEFFRLNV